jgi:hypothetical protein
MKKILTQYAVCALAVALMVPLALAQSQPAGMQAAFGKDAGTLSDKFTGLARVMSGKYDWKPGQGARSVGDVFNLIVRENGMLVGVLSGTPNTGAQPAPITDPEKLQEALKASYVNLQKAITGLSDNDLQVGETVRKRHDEAGRADADSRRSTRASGAVDRVRAQQRRGSALVQVGVPIASVKCWCTESVVLNDPTSKSSSETFQSALCRPHDDRGRSATTRGLR